MADMNDFIRGGNPDAEDQFTPQFYAINLFCGAGGQNEEYFDNRVEMLDRWLHERYPDHFKSGSGADQSQTAGNVGNWMARMFKTAEEPEHKPQLIPPTFDSVYTNPTFDGNTQRSLAWFDQDVYQALFEKETGVTPEDLIEYVQFIRDQKANEQKIPEDDFNARVRRQNRDQINERMNRAWVQNMFKINDMHTGRA